MRSLAECVTEMNRLFGNQFGRKNVIALWSVDQLRTFAPSELTELESLIKQSMLEENDRDNKRMMQRLLIRIKEAQGE